MAPTVSGPFFSAPPIFPYLQPLCLTVLVVRLNYVTDNNKVKDKGSGSLTLNNSSSSVELLNFNRSAFLSKEYIQWTYWEAKRRIKRSHINHCLTLFFHHL